MRLIKKNYKGLTPWSPRNPYGVHGVSVFTWRDKLITISLGDIISYSMKTYVYRYGVRGVRLAYNIW